MLKDLPWRHVMFHTVNISKPVTNFTCLSSFTKIKLNNVKHAHLRSEPIGQTPLGGPRGLRGRTGPSLFFASGKKVAYAEGEGLIQPKRAMPSPTSPSGLRRKQRHTPQERSSGGLVFNTSAYSNYSTGSQHKFYLPRRH